MKDSAPIKIMEQDIAAPINVPNYQPAIGFNDSNITPWIHVPNAWAVRAVNDNISSDSPSKP